MKIFVLLLLSVTLYSQKFCYINSKYILDNMSDYRHAKEDLLSKIKNWDYKLKELEDSIHIEENNLNLEKVLLTDKDIEHIKDKISKKRNRYLKMRDDIYGINGKVVKLNNNLINTFTENIYRVSKQIADRLGYSFVFDSSKGLIIVHANNRFDITKEVLNQIRNNKTNKNKNYEKN